jgi:hypothetical protein
MTMRDRLDRTLDEQMSAIYIGLKPSTRAKIVNALLSSMREPTAEMVFAGNSLTLKQMAMPGTVWETMIDAAAKSPA